MKVDDFYDMLPREFWNKIEGFHDLENMRQRSDWNVQDGVPVYC